MAASPAVAALPDMLLKPFNQSWERPLPANASRLGPVWLLLACLSLAVSAPAQTGPASLLTPAVPVSVTTSHPSGIYRVNEPIVVRVQVLHPATNPVRLINYSVKLHGARPLAGGPLELNNGTAAFTTRLTEPGSLLFTISGTNASGQQFSTLAGAVADYREIRWPQPLPDDFDAFWDAKLAESAQLPLHAREERVPWTAERGIEYSRVTLDNIHGSHIYGQLAHPRQPGKFPAILLVQYAGVYALKRENVTGLAREGWLVMNISAHDFPFDLPDSEMQKLADGPLKEYTTIGQTNRETSYFLRMFLGCQRAAEYLTTRPDWNGRVLVVKGVSQGGLQSIVAAALNPRVTAIMALEPAGCGNTAQALDRAWGWPYWQAHAQGPEAAKIINTSRYFDAVNFAHRVNCPALIGPGLMETTCPASNVLAMANRLRGPVEVLILPEAGHQAHNDKRGETPFNQRSAAWLQALKAGAAAPVETAHP